MKRLLSHAAFAAAMMALLLCGRARADLAEASALQTYLECGQRCSQASANKDKVEYKVALDACLLTCGSTQSSWDKNSDTRIDKYDYTLAVAELTGDVCPRSNGGIQHEAACCAAQQGEGQCDDADGDGLLRFQEEAVGSEDENAADFQVCTDSSRCGGFSRTCTYVEKADGLFCQVRPECADASAQTCTAFHLEKVSEDASEVIVRVHYDYTPVPPTVLDLRIRYAKNLLTLIDARPLAPLTEARKEMAVKSTTTGVRLVVVSTGNTRPIRPGAIAELVFRRLSGAADIAGIGFDLTSWNPAESVAPAPGPYRDELKEPTLWGGANDDNHGRNVSLVQMTAPTSPRKLLGYAFDAPTQPLVEQATASATELKCGRAASGCSLNNTDTALYTQLYSGVVEVNRSIEGVSGTGVYLDGTTNHLELPPDMTPDYSVSMWMYDEGDRPNTTGPGRVIFSHNTTSETTRYGLYLRESQTLGAVDLMWFDGDLDARNLEASPVAVGLPSRKWTHVALTVQGSTTPQAASIYVDGIERQRFQLQASLGAAPACPGVDIDGRPTFAKVGEANNVAPDRLLLATEQSNLFGIEEMDPNGLSKRDLYRDPQSSAFDAEYSAAARKMAFISSASGNYEVWIANADGTKPQRITDGFGDTARGIFARRPRWSPNGKAIVFESNVYGRASGHNMWGQTSQLYLIRFSPPLTGSEEGKVEIPVVRPGQPTVYVSRLDFSAIDSAKQAHLYALTGGPRNHTHAAWMAADRIVVNTADEEFDRRNIEVLTIPSTWADEPQGAVVKLSMGLASDLEQASMIAAANGRSEGYHSILFEKSWVSYTTPSDFSVTWQPSASGYTAQVTYTGSGLTEVTDLYLRYRSPIKPSTLLNGTVKFTPGAFISNAENKKALNVARRSTSYGELISIGVSSTTQARIIPTNTVLVTVEFERAADRTGDVAAAELVKRSGYEDNRALYVQRITPTTVQTLPLALSADGAALEQIVAGTLEPLYREVSVGGSLTGPRLALAGIVGARPVILTGSALDLIEPTQGSEGVARTRLSLISRAPTRVEGIQWLRNERLYPCEWVGGARDPRTGLFTGAFRGGMDELQVYNYVRKGAAINSEAERGFEVLRKLKRDGILPGGGLKCSVANEHVDCPAYQICLGADDNGVNGSCGQAPCNPNAPNACERGRCTPLPVPLEGKKSALSWVCAVDCATDANCFQQDCLNGPCRFCENKACVECKPAQTEFGVATIEGCPDQNSFECNQGSCLTDCYSFENGQAQYLCDPAAEYCNAGRCVAFAWSWQDLAPATLSGAGRMRLDVPRDVISYPVVTTQNYPITIEAFGIEDHLNPPEILIQGRHTYLHGGEWFDIGIIRVHNKTVSEAKLASNAYTIASTYPYEQLRLQLVLPPTRNVAEGDTGLGGRAPSLCAGNATCLASLDAVSLAPHASFVRLGYPLNIPLRDSWRDSALKGIQVEGSMHDVETDTYREFLRPGQPAVVITAVRIGHSKQQLLLQANGDVMHNLTCPYAASGGVQQAAPVAITPVGYAVLNCNYNRGGQTAELLLRIPNAHHKEGGIFQVDSGKVLETADLCKIEVDERTNTYEPCFESVGSSGNMDPYNFERQPKRTLDFETFQSFGYDMELVDVSGLGLD